MEFGYEHASQTNSDDTQDSESDESYVAAKPPAHKSKRKSTSKGRSKRATTVNVSRRPRQRKTVEREDSKSYLSDSSDDVSNYPDFDYLGDTAGEITSGTKRKLQDILEKEAVDDTELFRVLKPRDKEDRFGWSCAIYHIPPDVCGRPLFAGLELKEVVELLVHTQTDETENATYGDLARNPTLFMSRYMTLDRSLTTRPLLPDGIMIRQTSGKNPKTLKFMGKEILTRGIKFIAEDKRNDFVVQIGKLATYISLVTSATLHSAKKVKTKKDYLNMQNLVRQQILIVSQMIEAGVNNSSN